MDQTDAGSGSNSKTASQSSFHGFSSSQTSARSSGEPVAEQIPSITHSAANADGSRYYQAQKPIKEAVASAINATDAQHTAIPPDLLSQITSQITANVLQQLRASNVPTTNGSTANFAERADSVSSMDESSTLDRSKVYTPPSPQRATDVPPHAQTSPAFSNFSIGSRRAPSPSGNKRGPSPTSRPSVAEDLDLRDEKVRRPSAPQHASTTGDATTLEKIWGKLYCDQGKCTDRQSQFLRGVALHIIEDYEPKHSLVITPDKMQKYYEDTRIMSEFYPWQVIFDDRTSSISRMYRDLEIEHHLVQEQLDERPDIPALTPKGFQQWMTLVISAQPDMEHDRLARTALHMPISNADDRRERFPKELSRRLFPKEADLAVAAKLEKAMCKHCNIKLPARTNSTATETDTRPADGRPHSTYRTTGVAGASTTIPQRSKTTRVEKPRRNSVTEPPNGRLPHLSDSALDSSSDEPGLSQPIERERKPYVAQPGGGKNYDRLDQVEVPKTLPVPAPDAKLGRSNSVSSNSSRTNEPTRSRVPPVAVHQKLPASVSDMSDSYAASSSTRQRSNSFLGRTEARLSRNRSPSTTRLPGYAGEHIVRPAAQYRTDQYPPPPPPPQQDPRELRASFSGDPRTLDPRDRGRQRPRYQSTSQVDSRHRYPSEEDYYRTVPGYPVATDPSRAQYPPNSFRT